MLLRENNRQLGRIEIKETVIKEKGSEIAVWRTANKQYKVKHC